jgi:serine phosphatase RsbU (regulator of sigma subunit)
VASIPLSPRPEPPELSTVRRGVPARLRRLLTGPSLTVPATRLPVRRLTALALLGLTLTLSVAGAALVSLSQLTATNTQLAQVNRAQRYHQDADMMHDALRADVMRAQEAASGVIEVDAAVVGAEARRHTAQFRRDLRALAALDLPASLERSVDRLRPAQRAYIRAADRQVRAAVLGTPGLTPGARARYESAFQSLVPAQADVTARLAAASAQAERSADTDTRQAVEVIAAASLAAMTGWLGLIVWHHRSIGRLHGALVREAAHRSAADVLQRSLLPTRLPTVAGVEVAGRSLPGELGQRVGGDWYDVIALPTGEVGLVVGDVVGHDLAAATAMGQLRTALRAYALDDPSPAGVLARVNRAADLLDVVELATCLYAILDPVRLTVRWSSAGHLAPLVSSPCGSTRLLAVEPGPPLGAVPAPEYADSQLQLRPGDALALYTDGLVERRGEPIDAGLAALTSVRVPHPSADAMCELLMSRLLGEAPNADDVTLLVAQTGTGTGAGSRLH